MFTPHQFEINSLIGQDQDEITDPNSNHNFPSFDRNGFNELLHAIQAIPTIPTIPEPLPELQVNPQDSGNGRKRSIRRDRHSKIVTAKGPRDRRMRLSLDVAKKFFDLQDILGFDKASKTVDWLLTKSKSAIKSLSACGGGSRSEHMGSSSCGNWKIESSSTSECEVDSANPEEEEMIVQFAGAGEITRAHKSSTTRVSNSKKARKVNSDPILIKESRAKARARARERTREKMMMTTMMNTKQNGSTEVEQQQNNFHSKILNTSIVESSGDQSLPMMMREISTSDYNKNNGDDDNENAIDRIDPYSLYQEFWNPINSSSTVNDQDHHGVITDAAQFQSTWEEFNYQIK